MRSKFIVSAGCTALLSCACLAANAQESRYLVTVHPVGRGDGYQKVSVSAATLGSAPITVWHNTSIDPDCTARTPGAVLALVVPPEHGAVVIDDTPDYFAFPPANPRSACNTRKVPGHHAVYTSANGLQRPGQVRASRRDGPGYRAPHYRVGRRETAGLVILVVGAGPTGLNLALRLRRHGVAFRIVDRARGPGEQSRALAVQARTLEFYRQLGLADRAVAAGTVIEDIRMREAGSEVARVSLAGMGGTMSPYPFVLCLPQDEHERLLVEALAAGGVAVEWETRLTALSQDGEGASVTLSGPRGEERASFDYVAGCDGAHSAVREALGVGMAGGTYERLYYVADVKPRAPMSPELALGLERGGFALAMPSRKGENQRLIGFVPEGREADPRFEDVRESAERLLGVQIAEVNWFSTYRVHHRVAARFREGRCFLLGDAGHLHSPVGGQGMNTGIGDAVNLSWKLAHVVQGRAPETLLNTYEPERIGFARALVASTDRGFQVITDTGMVGNVIRGLVLPTLFPAVTAFEGARHAMFRVISQTRIAYPKSALSEGHAGAIAGGDRLPWVAGADNFAPLASLDWQVHVFGHPPAEFVAAAAALGLPVHGFAWGAAAEAAGFAEDAAYLARPDGYVALAMRSADMAALRDYLQRQGLRFEH